MNHTSRLFLAIALGLVGCSDKADTSVDPDSEVDSSGDGDTDGDTDTDSDLDTDPDTTSADEWTLDGTLTIPDDVIAPDGATVHVAVNAYNGSLITLGSWRSEEAGPLAEGLTYSLDLDNIPPDEHLQETDGYIRALYILGLYIDENGNGVTDPTDTFVAGSNSILVWVSPDGTIPADTAADGYTVGWNDVEVDFSAGTDSATPFEGDLTADLEANLLPTVPTDLILSFERRFPNDYVALSHSTYLDNVPSVPEPILAVAPGGIDFPAFPVPPDNHLEVFQWSESAMYRVVWFRDRDADGTFTSGDDTNCGDSDSNTVVTSGQGANNWGATYVRATDFMGQHSTIWYQQMGWSGIWYRDQVVGGQIRPNYTQAPWSYQLTVANFGCSG